MEVKDLRRNCNDKAINWVAICLEHLEIDASVSIIDMPDRIVTKDYVYLGLSEKLVSPHSYLIMLKKNLSNLKAKGVICHECAHIKQYELGDLEIIDNVIKYQGLNYYPPYNEDAPHERNAMALARKLKRLCK